jgi:hypothetical protein
VRNFIKGIAYAFFYKNGKVSKTAIILTLASLSLIGLWVFQSLFSGTVFAGWWTIPEFDAGSATAVMGTVVTLYCVNHSKLVSGNDAAELEELRTKIDTVVASVRRDDDD